ncbi:hypothetical protein AB0J21_10890 [Streptomyces sp. NPDC049954]|uniref:hypothetical protein n=1 Tax=Streptomyces sp. NPDC049954 TaxID=3155779 RepID=UPI00341A7B0D
MRTSASVRSRRARAGTTVAAAVAVAGATLAGAPAAHAAPGDSGNLDVRSVGWHSRGDRNGVEVCHFVLVATNFESLQAVPWTITAQPPTVPPGDTLQSTLPLINGAARSHQYLLPEGTYQLVWTVPAGPKQRSFKVNCDRPVKSGSHTGHGRPSAPGSENGYERPSGAVPAGGGGVPDMKSVSSEEDTNFAAPVALTAGAAGIAGLLLVRRSARRRARNEA